MERKGCQSHRAQNTLAHSEPAYGLLIGAGLMLRSFARLLSLDPGFDSSNLLNLRSRLRARKKPNRLAGTLLWRGDRAYRGCSWSKVRQRDQSRSDHRRCLGNAIPHRRSFYPTCG